MLHCTPQHTVQYSTLSGSLLLIESNNPPFKVIQEMCTSQKAIQMLFWFRVFVVCFHCVLLIEPLLVSWYVTPPWSFLQARSSSPHSHSYWWTWESLSEGGFLEVWEFCLWFCACLQTYCTSVRTVSESVATETEGGGGQDSRYTVVHSMRKTTVSWWEGFFPGRQCLYIHKW